MTKTAVTYKAIPKIQISSFPYSVVSKDGGFANLVNARINSVSFNLCNYLKSSGNGLFQVVDKLQKGIIFNKSDESLLEQFRKFIQARRKIGCDANMNTISIPQSKYHEVFNEIAKAVDYDSYLLNSHKTLKVTNEHVSNLFSIIKHCQDPESYPIAFPQWKRFNKHCGWSKSGSNEYDNLCYLYNNCGISGPTKHVCFAAYLDFLTHKLLETIATDIDQYDEKKLKYVFITYENEIDALLKAKNDNKQHEQHETDNNSSHEPPQEPNTNSGSFTHPLNLILYGPPGTGKTYNTLFKALEIIEGKTRENLDKEKNEQDEKWKKDTNNPKIEKKGYEVLKGRYDYCIKKGQIVFTTFHQSMSYEDFIEGIKPKVSNSKKQMTYEVQDGVFKQICDKAEKEQSANYVLIIDEINRGNVAQIFGELITLIEPNKRLGNSEEMKAILPYSSAQKGTSVYFGVPNNLYIIGTMNTADRSVEALDTALRRRFSFEEMMPKPELLKHENQKPLEACGVKLCDLLTTINARIVALKDREHQIGHSYFMGCPDKENDAKEWLKNVFKDKIIPLLQEYFYGDYKKIYYVLGPGFVEKITGKTTFAVENSYDYEFDIPEERYDIVSFDAKFNIKDAIDKMKVQKLDSGTGTMSTEATTIETGATAESEESTDKE